MATQPVPTPPPGFDELTKEEQIEYLHELWNRVIADEDDVPVPDWHLEVVRERLATRRPGGALSLDEVRARVLGNGEK